MRNITTGRLTITQDDYSILNAYLKGLKSQTAFDSKNALMLQMELKKAKLVKTDDLPSDVVRLNSKVKIQEGTNGNLIELTLVVPDEADIKQRKISVFAPVGTALIGFSKGQKVKWDVPSGQKTFTIVEVHNQRD